MDYAYLHVPFCQDICSYCDFTRCRYHPVVAEKWLGAIKKEITQKLHGVSLTTMYIGGGTPSCLQLDQLNSLLAMLYPFTQNVKEYTMEVNAESLSDDKLQCMKHYGVNRISMGVQTLQDTLLQQLHRHHNASLLKDTIARIHAHGIHAISCDLMYGLPQQTMKQWQQDLQAITLWDIQHISLYALSIEEHSAFGRGGVQPMDVDAEADMYAYAISYLEKQGFLHYEISNFAKEQHRSLHNQAYWHYDDFIGIGCGASGKKNHIRYDNTRNLHTYIEQGACCSEIKLSKQDEMFEMLMMSLRLKEGLDLAVFYQRFQIDFTKQYANALQRQIDAGMLVHQQGRVYTTMKGMLLLHDVLVDFL